MGITIKSGIELSNEDLENIAEMFERGEWPEGESKVLVGRPLKFGEELHSVTFKMPARKIAAIDAKAKEQDMSRSDYLRHLVDKDLKTSA